MNGFLNKNRPALFCPGCAHDRVVRALDEALTSLGLSRSKVALVTDIGCSGLLDTFFHTHAFHGLHGRALTYATGLKMAEPELKVIVVMGDGGLGIGGAHLLASCRKNLDLTLLVLNNFNYGMTGGQFSPTTPDQAMTSSGFLNRMEMPLDIGRVARAAGSPWVGSIQATGKGLVGGITEALDYHGFSMLEIQGICSGRYLRANKGQSPLTAPGNEIAGGVVVENERAEYSEEYRRQAARSPEDSGPHQVFPQSSSNLDGSYRLLLLGAAGQRISTAGELLCLAGMSGGLQVSQKNDYPITVLRGHSISEVIIDKEWIGYTGIESPDCILALDQAGVARRMASFSKMPGDGLVIRASEVDVPPTPVRTLVVDFKREFGAFPPDWALLALGLLAQQRELITPAMLDHALELRFAGKQLESAREMVGLTVTL